jgi:hypothetical protein
LSKLGSGLVAISLAVLQTFVPLQMEAIDSAQAILYSPDTKVPRTAEIALRKSIPAINPSMKAVQVETKIN